MPRNQSEKGPVILMTKKAKAQSWPSLQPVELRQEAPGHYRVRIRHHNRNVWHSYQTTSYAEAVLMYDKLADGFSFHNMTHSQWQYYGAA